MWYSVEAFVEDFRNVVLDGAEFVSLDHTFHDPDAFLRARLRDLTFSGAGVMDENDGRQYLWKALTTRLAETGQRHFEKEVTWKVFTRQAYQDSPMAEFLGILFTFLVRTEDEG